MFRLLGSFWRGHRLFHERSRCDIRRFDRWRSDNWCELQRDRSGAIGSLLVRPTQERQRRTSVYGEDEQGGHCPAAKLEAAGFCERRGIDRAHQGRPVGVAASGEAGEAEREGSADSKASRPTSATFRYPALRNKFITCIISP